MDNILVALSSDKVTMRIAALDELKSHMGTPEFYRCSFDSLCRVSKACRSLAEAAIQSKSGLTSSQLTVLHSTLSALMTIASGFQRRREICIKPLKAVVAFCGQVAGWNIPENSFEYLLRLGEISVQAVTLELQKRPQDAENAADSSRSLVALANELPSLFGRLLVVATGKLEASAPARVQSSALALISAIFKTHRLVECTESSAARAISVIVQLEDSRSATRSQPLLGQAARAFPLVFSRVVQELNALPVILSSFLSCLGDAIADDLLSVVRALNASKLLWPIPEPQRPELASLAKHLVADLVKYGRLDVAGEVAVLSDFKPEQLSSLPRGVAAFTVLEAVKSRRLSSLFFDYAKNSPIVCLALVAGLVCPDSALAGFPSLSEFFPSLDKATVAVSDLLRLAGLVESVIDNFAAVEDVNSFVATVCAGALMYKQLKLVDALNARFSAKVVSAVHRLVSLPSTAIAEFACPISGVLLLVTEVNVEKQQLAELCVHLEVIDAAKWLLAHVTSSEVRRLEQEHRAVCHDLVCRTCDFFRFARLRASLSCESAEVEVVTERAQDRRCLALAGELVNLVASSSEVAFSRMQRVAKLLLVFKLLGGSFDDEAVSVAYRGLQDAVRASVALEKSLSVERLHDADFFALAISVFSGQPLLDAASTPLGRRHVVAHWSLGVRPEDILLTSSDSLVGLCLLTLRSSNIADLQDGPLVPEAFSHRFAEGVLSMMPPLVQRLCLTFANAVVLADFSEAFAASQSATREPLTIACLLAFVKFSSERRQAAVRLLGVPGSAKSRVFDVLLHSRQGRLWSLWILNGLFSLELVSTADYSCSAAVAELHALVGKFKCGAGRPAPSTLAENYQFIDFLVIQSGSLDRQKLAPIAKWLSTREQTVTRRIRSVHAAAGFAVDVETKSRPDKKPRAERVIDCIKASLLSGVNHADPAVALVACVCSGLAELNTADAWCQLRRVKTGLGHVALDKSLKLIAAFSPVESRTIAEDIDDEDLALLPADIPITYAPASVCDIARRLGACADLPYAVLDALGRFKSLASELLGLVIHANQPRPSGKELSIFFGEEFFDRRSQSAVVKSLHFARSLFASSSHLFLPGRTSAFWQSIDFATVCETLLRTGLREEAVFWSILSLKLVPPSVSATSPKPWQALFTQPDSRLEILARVYRLEGFPSGESQSLLRSGAVASLHPRHVEAPVGVADAIAASKKLRKQRDLETAKDLLEVSVERQYGSLREKEEVELLFEYAKCLVSLSDSRGLELAKRLSEGVASMRGIPPVLVADILSKTGLWLGQKRAMSHSQVLSDYLRPAVEIAGKEDFPQARLRRVMALDTVIAEMTQLGQDAREELVVEAFKDLVFLLSLAETSLSKKKSLWVGSRFLAYWFSFGVKFEWISKTVAKATSLNSALLVPFCYQICSRLGAGRCDEALVRVVSLLLKGQPHECIPALLQLRQGDEGRRAVVDKLLSVAASGSARLKDLVESYSEMFKFYEAVANKESKMGGDLAELVGVRNFERLVSRDLYLLTSSAPGTRIAKIERQFTVADSGLSLPKILTVVDEFGHRHRQVVKGNDDLRNDAVMQQLFGILNEVSGLSLRTYKVVPLSPKSGVVEWVENTSTLGDYLAGSRGKDAAGAHARYFPDDVRPSDMRKKMDEARKAGKDLKTTMEKLAENFHPVFDMFFYEKFPTTDEFFRAHLRYVKSLAETSIVGFVCGISDRHPNNILIDHKTGDLVHIDFGMCFDQGKNLQIPERVPFRLTPDLVAALGPAGIDGPFLQLCERTAEQVRAQRSLILSVIEVFLHDPLYRWRENAEGPKKALAQVKRKLQGFVEDDPLPLDAGAQVRRLIQRAIDVEQLAQHFGGWQPWL